MAVRLRRDSVVAALARLDRTLAPTPLGHLYKLAGALDETTGDASVAAVLETVYGNTSPAATKAFERLRGRLAEAANAAGMALQLEVKGAKKLGGARRVAFVGEVPIAAKADMREIEDARSAGPLIDQQATPLPPVVVVLTVNDNETQAVFDAFLGEGKPPAPVEKGKRAYDELGMIGGYRVVHAQCEMAG
jgi:NACHT conflict system protein